MLLLMRKNKKRHKKPALMPLSDFPGCYIFTAAYFVERQAIESQIDISGKKIIV